MTRWNEEQERWSGGRYGEEERRGEWRPEHGGEEGWRGRDWRDEDRGGVWGGGEHREDWGWRGERGPMERWTSERDRERERWGERGPRDRGFGEREHEGWEEREGRRRRYGRGEYGGGGGYGERGFLGGPPSGAGGIYGGAGGGMSRGPYGAGTYGRGAYRGAYERWEAERGRGGRADSTRDFSESLRGYGEEEQGPLERMGEKVKEGFRKLTGRGPKGYRRSDERIRDDVSERIARSWVDAEDVEVKVENGEVTLTGFVERREDKRRLEDLADDVFGVEEVHNHLRLRRETATTLGAGTQQAGAGTATAGTTGQQTGQRTQQGAPKPGQE